MWTICRAEIKLNFRQPSFYAFLIFWTAILIFLFLLQNTSASISSYTNVTGTIMNLILYIVPLFMLIGGALSIAGELENGQFRLLQTFPLSNVSYMLGKFAGQYVSQFFIFTLSYGLGLAAGLLFHITFSLKWVLMIYLFSVLLMFFFLIIGLFIGALAGTRWFALSLSVFIWFFLIMLWPTVWIGVLNLLPYNFISPFLKTSIFLNPAELLRFVFVVQLNGGSVFGQPYDGMVSFFKSGFSWFTIIYYMLVFLFIHVFLVDFSLTRRRKK